MNKNILQIVLSGVLASFLILFAAANAQNAAPSEPSDERIAAQGIVFPIPELGNCASKDECKEYCNEATNMPACITFAKKHGLMTEEEAKTAEKFAGKVKSGKGPGDCNSPESCKAYCSDMAHLEECMSFAEEHGIEDEHYKHGKKILAHMKAGGKTPGGCQSKTECEAYCGDFSHAKECFEFAEKAGILQDLQEEGEDSFHRRDGPQQGKAGKMPTKEQMEKMMELAEKGETPGGCTGRESCEAYCSQEGRFEECMEFGVKAGFMSAEEANRIRKTGGKGPGGCSSPSACEAYCNNPSHQEECFTFAEEHGFMSKEETSQAREGWVRARGGFNDAPPEVRACIEAALGANILGGIQSGDFTPGPEVAGKVRACFEKFGVSAAPRDMFRNAPPKVLECLKSKVSDFDAIQKGEKMPTPEMADAFRSCFESMHMGQGMMQGENFRPMLPQGGDRQGAGVPGFPPNMPPEVAACLKEKFGSEFEKVAQGGQPSPEMEMKMRECFQNLPHPAPDGNWQAPPSGAGIQSVPPEVVPCLKEMLGEEGFQRLSTTPPGPEIYEKVRICYEKMVQSGAQKQEGQYPSQYPTESTQYPAGRTVSPESTTETKPTSFLKRLVANVLAPFRWAFGK